MEYTHIVDFASIVGIYWCACNTAEAGEESFRKRVKRVTGRVFHDRPLLVDALERKKSFQSSGIGGLYVLLRTRSRVAASSGMGSSFWKDILLDLFMVPIEIPG